LSFDAKLTQVLSGDLNTGNEGNIRSTTNNPLMIKGPQNVQTQEEIQRNIRGAIKRV